MSATATTKPHASVFSTVSTKNGPLKAVTLPTGGVLALMSKGQLTTTSQHSNNNIFAHKTCQVSDIAEEALRLTRETLNGRAHINCYNGNTTTTTTQTNTIGTLMCLGPPITRKTNNFARRNFVAVRLDVTHLSRFVRIFALFSFFFHFLLHFASSENHGPAATAILDNKHTPTVSPMASPRRTQRKMSSTTTTTTTPGVRLNKFVRRLHDMLLAEKDSGIVEWRRGLLVLHSTDAFAKQILPKYFNTRNFKTFRRQLNYYGFVHVRSFSTTGTSTTALWVNRDLAAQTATTPTESPDNISSVLLLRRVEPNESAKTTEGRRVRKELAIHTVEEDLGVSAKTLQMEQIQSLAHRYDDVVSSDASSSTSPTPIPSVIRLPRAVSTSSSGSNSNNSGSGYRQQQQQQPQQHRRRISSFDGGAAAAAAAAARSNSMLPLGSIPTEVPETSEDEESAANLLLTLFKSA